ncbi:MAG: TetR/AcrR family transcriptional regulator [Rhodoferax sp.]|nr:TetR/AcrR family transcriptional regulator [Rhodoferax sp.]MDP3650565.1 TetR/AcrR family transcriptional regulator [Rhodoferax sp.]
MSTPICLFEIAATVRAKRERRKEARPAELVAAALELFVEKGFAATRAEEVAKRAGVSKGTLFLYFASKEDLFKAVVRENISGRYPEWNARFEAYQGSTADLVRLFMRQWWIDVGNSAVSGISKLMMSEASNFPELAAFYQQEVIEPGSALIRRILQRGIDLGEFGPIDMKYGVYTILAPMLFLATWKHSFGTCCDANSRLVPEEYLSVQVETILHGLCKRPPTPPHPQETTAS